MLKILKFKHAFASAIIYSFYIQSFAQQIKTVTPPQEILIESPYKGEPTAYQSNLYTTFSKLPASTFHSICHDSSGRLWGTNQNIGFFSFDGVSLFLYGSNNDFMDRWKIITADRFGRVWIGGNGIGVTSPSEGLSLDWYIDRDKTIPDVHIKGICTDLNGGIWVSTSFAGINHVTEDTIITYNHENSILPESPGGYTNINTMMVDPQNCFWMKFRDDIFYMEENGELQKWKVHEEQGIRILGLICDGNNQMVMWDRENNIYDVTKTSIIKREISFPNEQIEQIDWMKFSPEGELYFGNQNKMFRLLNGKAQLILSEHLGPRFFERFSFDAQGGIWFSTQGIYHIPSQNIQRFKSNSIKGVHPEMQLMQKDNGELIGLKIDEDRVHHYIPLFEDGFAKGNQLKSIIECPNGYIIVDQNDDKRFVNLSGQQEKTPEVDVNSKRKIRDKSVYFYFDDKDTSEQLQFFDHENKLINTDESVKNLLFIKETDDHAYYFLSISDDNQSRIWKYKNGEKEVLLDHVLGDSLRLMGVRCLNDSTFYVATWGYFIAKITPSNTTFIKRGLGSNILRSCKNDYAGNFWSGGMEGGLNYMDAQTDSIINIKQSDGLLGGSVVTSIFVSEENDIILTTSLGVSCLWVKNPDLLVRNKDDFFQKYRLETYSAKSGLFGFNFNNVRMDKNGYIWVFSSGHWQVIYSAETSFTPEHLRIEKIQSINHSNKKKYHQFWLPGNKYLLPENIQLSHDDQLSVQLKCIYFSDINGLKYQYKIDQGTWSSPQNSGLLNISGFSNGEHTVTFRAIAPNNNLSEEVSIRITVAPPFYQTWWFILLIISVGFGLIYLVFQWRVKILKRRQEELENTVNERTEEISLQKIEIENQHLEIRDSIAYAKRIQEAILPPDNLIQKCLAEHFILYQPKDVVAGDFYWLEEVDEKVIFAVADCTGHGVPGAMVSVVCHNALSRSVKEFGLLSPDAILNKTRELVIERFEQGQTELNDGMDIALCVYDKSEQQVTFAGANNGVYLIREGELMETKGDKQPIGRFHAEKPFTAHTIQLQKNDRIYLYTDGYADQFGGDKGKKLKSSQFKKLLLQHHQHEMIQQKKNIHDAFTHWRGDLEQVDDVCVLGMKIN